MSLTSSRQTVASRFRIRYAIVAVITAIVIGTLAFAVIEKWTLLNSLYVAVQTVTTVGYGDVAPSTRAGRAFAIVFMLGGVGIVLYALTSTVHTIVESQLLATFGQKRRSRKMSKLRNHFIICGAGRVGSHLVRNLKAEAVPFVVIESDQKRVDELVDTGVNVLVRDATLEESLREAGVQHAHGLAACLPDDADNVYVVLTARDLNPKLHIVARAAEEQAESKLIRAGANRVVAPTIIGGHRMAVALSKPAVGDFIDSITANTLDLSFEQLEVASHSDFVGLRLKETDIRSELDIIVVGIRRNDGTMLFNPSGDAVINENDLLIVIGKSDSITILRSRLRGSGSKAVHKRR